MKNKQVTLTLPPPPPPLRFEDVNWSVVFEQEDFKTMGLCNRHVQIDNSGRDWHGMPLIVDKLAFPLQGSPYCLPFTQWGEKNLNNLLWQYEHMKKGEYATAEKLAYSWYLTSCAEAVPLPIVPLSREQYFYQRQIRLIRAGVLPSPRLARYYLVRETPEQYKARDEAAEAKGERYATNLERFARLDFFGRILFCVEGLIRTQRQELYYARLLSRAEMQQKVARADRQRESELRWLPVENQRDQARLERLRRRRDGTLEPVVQEVVQHRLFEAA